MWLHVCLLAGIAILAVLVIREKLPNQNILTVREWELLLLLLVAGNCLGAWMTYTRNKNIQWEEGMYFEKKEAGEGSYEKKMCAEVDGEEIVVHVQIPEQEGESRGNGGQEETKTAQEIMEPGLDDQILQAVSEHNQERKKDDKYYLPAYLNGKQVLWSRPWDTSGGILAALCVAGACCILIQKQKSKEQKRQKRFRQMLLDYPNLITRLALLVEAGMTVRRAFEKIALDYKRKNAADVRYAYEELLTSYYEMESGVMEEMAYENFGRRCGHPKYRTLATLLVQNLKKGNQYLLPILEKESADAFEERKRYARVQGEAAATKLLIPMVLMLLIVLVILIVPACMSFYQV